MSIGRICTRSVFVASPQETARDAARRMEENKVGALVVRDESDRPVGVITDRDIAVRVVAHYHDPDDTPIYRVMSQPVVTMRESAAIEDAIAEMARVSARRIVVTDDGGRLVGLLALDDVLDLLAEETESIGRILAKQRSG